MTAVSFIPLMRAQSMHARQFLSDDCTSGADALQRARRVREMFRSVPQPTVKLVAPLALLDEPIELEAENIANGEAIPRARDWLIIDPSIMPRMNKHPYAWERIIEEVATEHRTTVIAILSNRRAHEIVLARHEAFWRLQNDLGMSYSEIGRHCGGRDHTTVRNGVMRHEKRIGLLGGYTRRVRDIETPKAEREEIVQLIRAGRSNYAIRQIMKIGIIKVRRVRAEMEASL